MGHDLGSSLLSMVQRGGKQQQLAEPGSTLMYGTRTVTKYRLVLYPNCMALICTKKPCIHSHTSTKSSREAGFSKR